MSEVVGRGGEFWAQLTERHAIDMGSLIQVANKLEKHLALPRTADRADSAGLTVHILTQAEQTAAPAV